jgi:ABC-type branched-subunit amino acid transport system substrate-binding protein
MRARVVAAGLAMIFVVAACGNSESAKTSDEPTGTTVPGGIQPVSEADQKKNVPIDEEGVTDTEIGVAVITSTTNIIGGRYAEYADGIQAYFDYVNSQGGLYGRQFKILKHRDDQMLNNQATVKASLSQDKAFATFNAGPVFSGATDLAAAKQPTFIWNINPEMIGKTNIFGSIPAICFKCEGQASPFLAKSQGVKTVGVLAYGSTPSSKECGSTAKKAFEKYGESKVGFFDNNVTYAQPDLSSQVSGMKKAGVEMVFICMDGKEAIVLGKEIKRQNLDAVMSLPNAYDEEYIRDNADVLEGSFVAPQFVPFEKEPQLPEHELIREWVGKLDNGSGKTIRELTVEGWAMAALFVHGLKLAGPEFDKQKLISSLNQETNWTANGLKVPQDWTKGHKDPYENPEARGEWNCGSILKVEGGKLVPVLDEPGKPWVCTGPDSDPVLTETPTYESFAPTK